MDSKGVFAGVLCCFLLACGSDGGDKKGGSGSEQPADGGAAGEQSGGGEGGSGDSRSAGSEDVGDNPSGVTVEVDEAGGVLEFEGVTVTVPKLALGAPTRLTLRRTGSSVPGFALYSDVYELLPASLEFVSDVTVRMPFKGDPSLANVFTRSDSKAAFSWRATTIDDHIASATLRSGRSIFVADGASSQDKPDPTCTSVTVVDGSFGQDRLLNVLARASDCQGRSLVARDASNFVAVEDGVPTADVAVQMRDSAPIGRFVTLLIDAEALRDGAQEIEKAARAAVAELKDPSLRLGISVYGVGAGTTELLSPTLDAAAVSAALEQLGSFPVPAKLLREPYGALATVVSKSAALRGDFKKRNAGGAFSAGFVIWVSASESDETDLEKSAALEIIVDAGEQVISIPNRDLEPAEFGSDEYFAAPEPAALSRAWQAATQRVAGLLASTYWLGYCSTKSAGLHELSVRLTSDYFALGRAGLFDATGSLGGCNDVAPLEDCDGRECGGAGCGACDDTASRCDGATGKCLSFCETEHWCGGESQTNPAGYLQACNDMPSSTFCSSVCVDLQNDTNNCGACATKCLPGGACEAGECKCPVGFDQCEGACVDTSHSSSHCGKCGSACGSGEGCFAGKCANACPASLHGPVLVKVPTPAGGIMCIDATEVTRGQYSAFLADRGSDTDGQVPECSWNLYFEPPEYCTVNLYAVSNPEKHPQECIDWCDAAAFCAWAGKRLCGGIEQPHVDLADLTNASKDEWYNACSSGGTQPYPFGSTCQVSPCTWSSNASTEAGQAEGCQAKGAYAGVFDLSGNVKEWEDGCDGRTGKYDRCQTRGSKYGENPSNCLSAEQAGIGKCGYVDAFNTLLERRSVQSGGIRDESDRCHT